MCGAHLRAEKARLLPILRLTPVRREPQGAVTGEGVETLSAIPDRVEGRLPKLPASVRERDRSRLHQARLPCHDTLVSDSAAESQNLCATRPHSLLACVVIALHPLRPLAPVRDWLPHSVYMFHTNIDTTKETRRIQHLARP
jgi:hypothetical protein